MPKLIGITLIKGSTGKIQCDAAVKLAQDWNILGNIVGVCFDTKATQVIKRSSNFN